MKSFLSLLSLSFLSSFSYAYPEMIRHGYVSCTTCHLSPSGGGLLTSYGKSLAKELLTFKSTKKLEESIDDEKSKNQEVIEKWIYGANARALLFHRDNEYESSYVTIPMQLEANGAYNTDKYAFVLGAGVAGQRSGNGAEGGPAFILSNAYGLYRLNDEFNIRLGQFLPAYGLNNALHATGTRAPIGFGYKDQRPTLELSFISDNWTFFVSQSTEKSSNHGKSATSAQGQYNITQSSKLALNYWTESDLRELYGFWFVTPVYEHFYLSADYNIQKEKKFETEGLFYYAKFGYEFRQGIHGYLMKDFSHRDTQLKFTKVDRYGIGVQVFPLLNWEVDAVWLKEKNLVSSQVEGDYAYIMVHYYL